MVALRVETQSDPQSLITWRSRSTIIRQSHIRASGSELRLLYRLFEDAQRARVAHGERLRAFLQGRSFAGSGETLGYVDELLTEIQRGHAAGAPVLLERAYARAADEEEMLAVELRGAVEGLSRLGLARTAAGHWTPSGGAAVVAARCGARENAIGVLGVLRDRRPCLAPPIAAPSAALRLGFQPDIE